MRIQHNILAMNAYRNYNTNTSALAKNLEKLSSGYKINRAGDDAAGLAISEKMRAQITGLNAAQKNVKDGISLVKTAEGAMQEIQDMLNRMDYLATQSANGTYDDPVDRLNLNKEVEALKTEINRIADSANFNGIKLLDGSLADTTTRSISADSVNKSDITSLTCTTAAGGASCCQPHKAGEAAKDASFKIDLKQVMTGIEATKAMSAGSTFNLKVKLGTSASVTIQVTLKKGVATGARIAWSKDFIDSITIASVNGNAVNAAAASATITGFKSVGGAAASQSFDIKLETTIGDDISNGVLTFTQKATAANKDFCVTALKVTAQASGGMKTGSVATHSVSINCSVLDPHNGTAEKAKQLAHAHFDLSDITSMDLEKGVVNIGDISVTFDTKSKDTKAGVVGVKDLIDANGKLKAGASTTAEFGRRLAVAAADNKTFTVGLSSDGTKITLEERFNYWDGDDPLHDKYLDSKDKIAKQVWFGTMKEGNTSTSGANGGLVLQIGDTSDDFNRLTVNVGDMHVAAMGEVNAQTGKVSGVRIADIDIKTAESAKDAIGVIKGAINYVSGVRGDLGAVQNRLEHTANNLSVMAENIQDAESTIRDTDIAEEMMSYTKNNILVQSAQAMLAQANAVPQGVLQLLG